MYLGRIVEQGSVAQVLGNPQHPYTRALLAAVPRATVAAGARADVALVKGDLPSPANPPAGCHFHPRCPLATQMCRQEYPRPRAVDGTHIVSCHLAG